MFYSNDTHIVSNGRTDANEAKLPVILEADWKDAKLKA